MAGKISLLDKPDGRKNHLHPTPLVGGIAMFLALALACALFLPQDGMVGYWLGALLLLVVGFLDDWRDLGHRFKFVIQALAVLAISFFSRTDLVTFGDLLYLGEITVPLGWLSVLVTIFCAVGIINAVNMIDGLDGLAGGVSFIAFAAFSVITWLNGDLQLTLFCLAYTGAILGFLKYNWAPAQVFMGDAGSFTLGFSLLFVAINSSQAADSLVRPVSALLIMAVPIVDTLTIMTRRVMAGRSPFLADRYHLHHLLVRFGFSRAAAVQIILVLATVSALAAIGGVVFRVPDHLQFLVFMLFFAAYFSASFFIKDFLKMFLQGKREYSDR
ncbi:MAG: undecaprenyl/decaprenyl-phosphate alpha-N-acetylglucosaminyl 1-phosphate transferase [Desulfobulbaceae bacterium]|nr:undecaprenyl/decaprenyl-phosphate alpha-N-acetylglucosaminyl 1-phosphate transferase [Desulfobulbaceae bacterium]